MALLRAREKSTSSLLYPGVLTLAMLFESVWFLSDDRSSPRSSMERVVLSNTSATPFKQKTFLPGSGRKVHALLLYLAPSSATRRSWRTCALDPWLCVPTFQWVCLYRFVPYSLFVQVTIPRKLWRVLPFQEIFSPICSRPSSAPMKNPGLLSNLRCAA